MYANERGTAKEKDFLIALFALALFRNRIVGAATSQSDRVQGAVNAVGDDS